MFRRRLVQDRGSALRSYAGSGRGVVVCVAADTGDPALRVDGLAALRGQDEHAGEALLGAAVVRLEGLSGGEEGEREEKRGREMHWEDA